MELREASATASVSEPVELTVAPLDESDFIARLRSGEDDAFEELVRAQSRRLLGLCRRLLGNDEDARDAVQETFVAAFRSLDRFRADARLSTWLSRIAVNQALMKLRSRRRKPEQSIEELLPRYLEDGHQARSSERWSLPADAAIEEKERRTLVRRHIDELPENYRTVLLLRDIQEMDTEEVATLLGVSTNTVKVRLHRARQALRGLLAPHFEKAAV